MNTRAVIAAIVLGPWSGACSYVPASTDDDALPMVLDGGPLTDTTAADDTTTSDDATLATDAAPQPRCGDAIKNGDEECDGRDLGGASCTTLGYVRGELLCDGSCLYKTAFCDFCGDGVRDANEECDPGNPLLGLPADFGPQGPGCAENGFYCGGIVGCDNCWILPVECNCPGTCGDGVRNWSVFRNAWKEECDGGDLGGETCASLGLPNPDGTLACNPWCRFDASLCGGCGWPLACPLYASCMRGRCDWLCWTDADCNGSLGCMGSRCVME